MPSSFFSSFLFEDRIGLFTSASNGTVSSHKGPGRKRRIPEKRRVEVSGFANPYPTRSTEER